MTDEEHRRSREERKRKEAEAKAKQKQRLSLHQKHKDRRRKDNMIGMPFIIAFQGDPARPFYCNDVRDIFNHDEPTYELIHEDKSQSKIIRDMSFARLRRYISHHVVSMYAKVLIYKAGNEQ